MNTDTREPEACFEFDFPRLDTVVCVQRFGDAVVIQASRDTFTAERRQCFVRELIAEGFIPEDVRWTNGPRLEWRVDAAWLMPNKAVMTRTGRAMVGTMLGALALWVALVTWMVSRTPSVERLDTHGSRPQTTTTMNRLSVKSAR